MGGYCREVDELVQVYHHESGGSMKLAGARMGEVLSKMLMLSYQYRVELDPRFASVSGMIGENTDLYCFS